MNELLVHSVFFWLKPDADTAMFEAEIATLKDIDCAQAVYIGTPADTGDRPVIERSYTFALNVLFDNVADQAAYQVHPVHLAFVDKCKGSWEKVLVYDAD